jgi:ABC-type dipeptide/oligopeptide/nickel transport system permease subunit
VDRDQAFRRARSIGARAPMLMLRHILPGTLPSEIAYYSLRVARRS